MLLTSQSISKSLPHAQLPLVSVRQVISLERSATFACQSSDPAIETRQYRRPFNFTARVPSGTSSMSSSFPDTHHFMKDLPLLLHIVPLHTYCPESSTWLILCMGELQCEQWRVTELPSFAEQLISPHPSHSPRLSSQRKQQYRSGKQSYQIVVTLNDFTMYYNIYKAIEI